MTYAVGLDKRSLLPPFMPVLRNSDSLFGTLLPLVDPDAFFGYLPQAITHLPPERRGCPGRSYLATPAGSDSISMIGMVILSFPLTATAGGTETDRTMALGRYLQSVSRLGVPEFIEFLLPRYLRDKARLIGELERLLVIHKGQPQAWAEDVQGSIDAIYAALETRASLCPRDLCVGRTPDEAIALLLDLIGRYGELLEYWPDIVIAAKNLRERGIRLAVPV